VAKSGNASWRFPGISAYIKHHSSKINEMCNLLRNIRFPNAVGPEESQRTLTELNHELWNRAADMVLQVEEVVVGLGQRLASEVHEIGRQALLSRDEIEKLPAIISFLGRQNERK
jgi:hypothetical protein